MTTPAALPSLAGLAWSRHKKPGFSTRVASHVSGREVRVALMSYPLYEFEAVYNGLASSSTAAFASLGSSSLQSLMGFFLQLLGQAGVFLYTDPDDNSVAAQIIGSGDGVTQSFVMGRTLGGFTEPVGWVSNVANVYLNGVLQSPSTWTFTAPNSIGFYSAPAAGVSIAADFSFAFQCRFLDDQMDFEEFMSSLWKLDSMKFRSVKANATPAAAPFWGNTYSIGGTLPTLFADFTTEGVADHYYYNGATAANCAALLAALGTTFSRSSPAYYQNSSGVLTLASSGVLRFDWSGGTALGILLEGPSTNSVTYSQAAFSSHWSAGGISITDSNATGPDGTGDASTVTDTTANTEHQFYQGTIVGLTAGAPVTESIFVKAGTLNYFGLCFQGGSNPGSHYAGAVFNLTTGAVTSTSVDSAGSAIVGTSAVAYGNGWWRIAFTATLPSSETSVYAEFNLSNSATPTFAQAQPKYAGTGSGTVLVFGAQLEFGLPFASSYIPTTTGSTSRAADSLSAATWAAITAGTLYVQADAAGVTQTQRLVQIDDGTENNRATLNFKSTGAGEFDFVKSGTAEADVTAGAIAANTPEQIAAAFQVNDFALVVNGGTAATAASGAIPTFGKLRLGQDSGGGNPLFGHIRQLGVWNNLRGPNANLQSLT
jgi:hypothetical protein